MGMTSVGQERDQAGVRRDHEGDRRDRTANERDYAGEQRDEAASHRDMAAIRRDMAAEQRDRAADQRDQAAELSEVTMGQAKATDPISRAVLARREAASDRGRASKDRLAGARERTRAEDDRGTSSADRGAGACERTESEHDRGAALADRGASAVERKHAGVDGLTGAYLRDAGSIELERDMARAKREEQPLVLAFIDVDGLKAVNDSRGHAAGDRLLVEVVDTFRAGLRPHDLLIRHGGDEFVCAISGLTTADAKIRLAGVNATLGRAPEHGSVTMGLAEMRPDDSSARLVARADAALYRNREQQRTDDRKVRPRSQLGDRGVDPRTSAV